MTWRWDDVGMWTFVATLFAVFVWGQLFDKKRWTFWVVARAVTVATVGMALSVGLAYATFGRS